MERWLPRGFQIESGTTVGKQLSFGSEWQLYMSNARGFVVAVTQFLYEKWTSFAIFPPDLLKPVETPHQKVWVGYDNQKYLIASVKEGPYPGNIEDARAFAKALKKARKAIPDASFEDALYFERYSLVLPTYEGNSMDDQTVLCRWLASGVEISIDRFNRLCELASWLPPTALASVIRDAGFSVSEDTVMLLEKNKTQEVDEKECVISVKQRKTPEQIKEHFSLPGRPALEAFFNEHVVDIIRNSERYKRMGIGFPSAVILHGPPGCGKTFAVERLIDFLGWPSYNIDSGSIGSPFIHDTSKKISEVFDKAIDNAPSVLVIDEMEAFLSARDLSQGSGQHHVEEVAEFLRRIPEATSKNVLVIAMTNLIDTIDPAILRRGRFDHVIEVQMPSKEEVDALLHHLLESLPVSEDIDYEGIASQLKGHAMSDVTFVVKEAGRLAVKNDSYTISNENINAAINCLPKKKDNTRKIGF